MAEGLPTSELLKLSLRAVQDEGLDAAVGELHSGLQGGLGVDENVVFRVLRDVNGQQRWWEVERAFLRKFGVELEQIMESELSPDESSTAWDILNANGVHRDGVGSNKEYAENFVERMFPGDPPTRRLLASTIRTDRGCERILCRPETPEARALTSLLQKLLQNPDRVVTPSEWVSAFCKQYGVNAEGVGSKSPRRRAPSPHPDPLLSKVLQLEKQISGLRTPTLSFADTPHYTCDSPATPNPVTQPTETSPTPMQPNSPKAVEATPPSPPAPTPAPAPPSDILSLTSAIEEQLSTCQSAATPRTHVATEGDSINDVKRLAEGYGVLANMNNELQEQLSGHQQQVALLKNSEAATHTLKDLLDMKQNEVDAANDKIQAQDEQLKLHTEQLGEANEREDALKVHVRMAEDRRAEAEAERDLLRDHKDEMRAELRKELEEMIETTTKEAEHYKQSHMAGSSVQQDLILTCEASVREGSEALRLQTLQLFYMQAELAVRSDQHVTLTTKLTRDLNEATKRLEKQEEESALRYKRLEDEAAARMAKLDEEHFATLQKRDEEAAKRQARSEEEASRKRMQLDEENAKKIERLEEEHAQRLARAEQETVAKAEQLEQEQKARQARLESEQARKQAELEADAAAEIARATAKIRREHEAEDALRAENEEEQKRKCAALQRERDSLAARLRESRSPQEVLEIERAHQSAAQERERQHETKLWEQQEENRKLSWERDEAAAKLKASQELQAAQQTALQESEQQYRAAQKERDQQHQDTMRELEDRHNKRGAEVERQRDELALALQEQQAQQQAAQQEQAQMQENARQTEALLQEQEAQLRAQAAKHEEQEVLLQEQEAQLRAQAAQSEEQGVQLREQGAQLQEKEEKLQEQDVKLQEQEQQLVTCMGELEEQKSEKSKQTALYEESAGQVAALQERNAELQDSNTQLSEQGGVTRSSDATQAELLDTKAELERLKEEAENREAEDKARHEAAEEELARKNAELSEQGSTLEKREQELQRLTAELEEKERELQDASQADPNAEQDKRKRLEEQRELKKRALNSEEQLQGEREKAAAEKKRADEEQKRATLERRKREKAEKEKAALMGENQKILEQLSSDEARSADDLERRLKRQERENSDLTQQQKDALQEHEAELVKLQGVVDRQDAELVLLREQIKNIHAEALRQRNIQDVNRAQDVDRQAIEAQEQRSRKYLERHWRRIEMPFGVEGSVQIKVKGPTKTDVEPAVVISECVVNGAAHRAGLKAGMLVVKVRNPIGTWPIVTRGDFLQAIGPSGHAFENVELTMFVVQDEKFIGEWRRRLMEHVKNEERQKQSGSWMGKMRGKAQKTRFSGIKMKPPPANLVKEFKVKIDKMGDDAKRNRIKHLKQMGLLKFGEEFNAENVFQMQSQPQMWRTLVLTGCDQCNINGSREMIPRTLANPIVGTLGAILGCTPPTKEVVDEAFSIVDLEGIGEVDFEELTTFTRELYMDVVFREEIVPNEL